MQNNRGRLFACTQFIEELHNLSKNESRKSSTLCSSDVQVVDVPPGRLVLDVFCLSVDDVLLGVYRLVPQHL